MSSWASYEHYISVSLWITIHHNRITQVRRDHTRSPRRSGWTPNSDRVAQDSHPIRFWQPARPDSTASVGNRLSAQFSQPRMYLCPPSLVHSHCSAPHCPALISSATSTKALHSSHCSHSKQTRPWPSQQPQWGFDNVFLTFGWESSQPPVLSAPHALPCTSLVGALGVPSQHVAARHDGGARPRLLLFPDLTKSCAAQPAEVPLYSSSVLKHIWLIYTFWN